MEPIPHPTPQELEAWSPNHWTTKEVQETPGLYVLLPSELGDQEQGLGRQDHDRPTICIFSCHMPAYDLRYVMEH